MQVQLLAQLDSRVEEQRHDDDLSHQHNTHQPRCSQQDDHGSRHPDDSIALQFLPNIHRCKRETNIGENECCELVSTTANDMSLVHSDEPEK